MLIGGRFQLEDKLGSGSFASVYCALDTKTNEKVAVKLENPNSDQTKASSETGFLSALANSPYFPKLIWQGKHNNSRVIVTDLLGPSLFAEYLKRTRFTNMEISSIGTQMVSALETVHDFGVIHRDIKPDNILIDPIIGIEKVYLIDFGIAKRYADPISKQQIPFRDDNEFSGNFMFASRNVVVGCTPSRRDDLESLTYTLIFLLTGNLPWCKKRSSSESIRERRQSGILSDNFAGIPEELSNIVTYCQNLKYHERPNYAYIISQLNELSKKEDFYIRSSNRRRDIIPLETEFRSRIVQKRSKSANHKGRLNNKDDIRRGQSNNNIDADNNPTIDGSSPRITPEMRQRILGLRRDSGENATLNFVAVM